MEWVVRFQCQATITSGVTNAAWRITVKNTSGATVTTVRLDILVWGAQAEESTTAGEYVKTTSTINSAPRFDHKATRTTTNLFLNSEDFSTTWLPQRGTVTTDAITAPDGTSTADKLTDTAASGSYVYQSVTVSSGTVYTQSVFFKSAESTSAVIQTFGNSAIPGALTTFDLANGTVSSLGHTSASISDNGNGWWRCSIQWTATGNGTGNTGFSLSEDVIGKGVYLWGAQLERASDVGPYVKTTGASATKVDAESLGLLVEEARTNLIDNSEANINVWTNHSGSGITKTNLTDNAWGRFNGVQFTNNGVNWYGINSPNFAITNGTAYSVTVFAKYDTANNIRIALRNNIAGVESRVSGSPGNLTAILHQAGTITNIVEELFDDNRVKITFTVTANNTSSSNYIRVGTGLSDSNSVVIYAVQVDRSSSFPTSYIPTSGSTVTRAADVTEITGNDFGTFNLVEYSEELSEPLTAFWDDRGTYETRFDSSALSPIDTAGVWYLTNDSDIGYDNTFRTSPVSVSASTTYTFSVYAKARNNETGLLLRILDLTGTSVVEAKTINSSWQRFSITITTSGTAVNVLALIGLDSASDEVYLWGAQLEESSTATPYVKSDVTWTSRASNATYYDYTGTLRKSSYNLLQRSEELDNSYWTKARSSITADSTTAPNGTQTADKVVESTDTANHEIYVSSFVFTSGVPVTISCFAKAGERSKFRFGLTGNVAGSNTNAYFDVANGATAELHGGFTSSKVTDQGNGWYRCEATLIPTATLTSQIYITFVLAGTTTTSYTGDGSSGLFLWGVQAETGPYAGDYAKTTSAAASSARDVAFLPDSNGNFVSAGELLLEEARTNRIGTSEKFSVSGGGWTEVNPTISANHAVAPDGTNTATLVTGSGGAYGGLIRQNPTSISAVANTMSVYAKAGTHDSIGFRIGSQMREGQNYARFNLTTGVVTTITPDAGTINDIYMENVGNGWYRCVLTYTPATGGGFADIALVDSSTGNHDYRETGTVILWGAQFEQGSYATSYIPTFGATATRAADVSSSSSNTFGNSFYKQSEGTMFSEVKMLSATPDNYSNIFELQKSDNTDRLFVRYPNFQGWEAAGQTNLFLSRPFAQESKVALGFKTNDTILTANGNSATDTSVTIDETKNELCIGYSGDSNFGTLNGTIKRLTCWPQRLPDATLQTITT